MEVVKGMPDEEGDDSETGEVDVEENGGEAEAGEDNGEGVD